MVRILHAHCILAVFAQFGLSAPVQECLDDETSFIQLHSTVTQGKSVQLHGHASQGQDDDCGDEMLEVKGSEKKMPARGFITCCDLSVSQDEMVDSMKGYLKKGGRLIDTAPDYGYEKAVAKAVKDSGVDRDEMWLSSKIDTDGWRGIMGSPKKWVLTQVDNSLNQMGAKHLDSMVLHFGPKQVKLQAPDIPEKDAPNYAQMHTVEPDDYVEMWNGLIEAKKAGKVHNIGVCESSRKEIENLIEKTGVAPSIALVLFHPWVPAKQKEFVSWLQSKDVAVQSYSLFAPFKAIPGKDQNPYTDAAKKVASSHGATHGQVAIRWARKNGVGFMTRFNSKFLDEDLKCNSFELDSEDDKKAFSSAPEWACDLTVMLAKQYMPGCKA
jgi:2,5-diketo-D-gluconate reductase A